MQSWLNKPDSVIRRALVRAHGGSFNSYKYCSIACEEVQYCLYVGAVLQWQGTTM